MKNPPIKISESNFNEMVPEDMRLTTNTIMKVVMICPRIKSSLLDVH